MGRPIRLSVLRSDSLLARSPSMRYLPDPAHMLSWDQHTRVIGFRNTYRQYPPGT